jgi:hypothetical protein
MIEVVLPNFFPFNQIHQLAKRENNFASRISTVSAFKIAVNKRNLISFQSEILILKNWAKQQNTTLAR